MCLEGAGEGDVSGLARPEGFDCYETMGLGVEGAWFRVLDLGFREFRAMHSRPDVQILRHRR